MELDASAKAWLPCPAILVDAAGRMLVSVSEKCQLHQIFVQLVTENLMPR